MLRCDKNSAEFVNNAHPKLKPILILCSVPFVMSFVCHFQHNINLNIIHKQSVAWNSQSVQLAEFCSVLANDEGFCQSLVGVTL